MPRKRGPGRPSLGTRGRNVVVSVKFSAAEVAAIEAVVAAENARMLADGNDDGQSATVSSWIRDHALDPLGLATFTTE